MKNNLQKQQNLVENEVIEYRRYLMRGIGRAFLPHNLLKMLFIWLKSSIEFKFGNSKQNHKVKWDDLLMNIIYSEDEIKSPFFEIAREPHTLHKLSCYIKNKYPEISFCKLIKIQELSNINNKLPKIKTTILLILTIGSVLLTLVPKELISYLDIDYASFKIGSFLVFLAIFIFGVIFSISFYFSNEIKRLLEEVIRYSEAIDSE